MSAAALLIKKSLKCSLLWLPARLQVPAGLAVTCKNKKPVLELKDRI